MINTTSMYELTHNTNAKDKFGVVIVR